MRRDIVYVWGFAMTWGHLSKGWCRWSGIPVATARNAVCAVRCRQAHGAKDVAGFAATLEMASGYRWSFF